MGAPTRVVAHATFQEFTALIMPILLVGHAEFVHTTSSTSPIN